jgi:hypothetical protein
VHGKRRTEKSRLTTTANQARFHTLNRWTLEIAEGNATIRIVAARQEHSPQIPGIANNVPIDLHRTLPSNVRWCEGGKTFSTIASTFVDTFSGLGYSDGVS